ncbi:hypothetical protein [Woodsholea maritima]|uniref:hypothetical protein n=1 Tax=Woodsholea maritima TaxID=240237 RepID=UPI0003827CF7|nr:hypothetical protein [Woodsholea maritima]
MTTDNTRLNIERAREALHRAKPSSLAAIRSPRPVDLRQLDAEQTQRAKIDLHADAFRHTLREKLGVHTFNGDYQPMMTPTARALMNDPMCDADVCMPRSLSSLMPQPAPAPRLDRGEDAQIDINAVLETGVALRDAQGDDAAITPEIEITPEEEPVSTEAHAEVTPSPSIATHDKAIESDVEIESQEAPLTEMSPASEAPKKRKKFLGLF